MYWLFRNLRFLFLASTMEFVTANDQCRTEVNIQGMALKRSVFKRWSVATPHLCDVKCGQEITCQSYNYNRKYQICELNNRTKEARPENLLSAPSWFYIRRLNGRAPLGSIPELPSIYCLEIKASEGKNTTSGKYWLDPTGTGKAILINCDMASGDMDECKYNISDCDVNANCTNTESSYKCTCKAGYTGDGHSCSDIDECKGNRPCHVNATCMNTLGSHLCQCHAGYTGNGQNCSDVDECDDGSHLCDENANCTNTNGSHNCICKKGYTGDGKSCQDIDECSDGSNICDENANCTNFIGSYNCSCTEGYTGSGQSCQDIDECSEAHAVKMNKCHPNASCTNTRGSYNCSCIPGYIGDGFQCKVDPCYEYKNLSDFQRKSSYHTPLNEESCDWELYGWYRFVGAAGTKMPTTYVAPFRCGTASSGWLHGTHPTVEHGVVYRKVCFSIYIRHCRFKTNILVKNCSSYYIYKLFRTPRCSSRYCGTD